MTDYNKQGYLAASGEYGKSWLNGGKWDKIVRIRVQSEKERCFS